jgi:putative transposase
MPRGARLILDNACYHLMARGNQKQSTFIEDEDFIKYLELLRHYKRKYCFKLYGYCLMPNHVHLIVELEKSSILGKIMQGLNLAYAVWFNKKYNKVGHLWQGRYKSTLIQKDKYLLDCIEYVEFNPIRSNMNKSPFDHPWNSWRERMGYKQDDLLDTPYLS